MARNHEEVLAALRTASVPITAYQVLRLLPPVRLWAPITVYRALRRLIDMGLVHRVESLDAYVVCSRQHCRTSVATFLICENCSGVDEVADDGHSEGLANIALAHGFRMQRATIELTGCCAECMRKLAIGKPQATAAQ